MRTGLVKQEKGRNPTLMSQNAGLSQSECEDQSLLLASRAITRRLVFLAVPGHELGPVRASRQSPPCGGIAIAPVTQGRSKTVFRIGRRDFLRKVGFDRAVQREIGLRKCPLRPRINLGLKSGECIKTGSRNRHAMSGHLVFNRIQPCRVRPTIIQQALPPCPDFFIGACRFGMRRIGRVNEPVKKFEPVRAGPGEQAVLGRRQPDHRYEPSELSLWRRLTVNSGFPPPTLLRTDANAMREPPAFNLGEHAPLRRDLVT